MMHGIRNGLTDKGLKVWLLVFFTALLLPSSLLILEAYSQLKWEAFHQLRVRSISLADDIDEELQALVAIEESRSFADYTFEALETDSTDHFLVRSPLSSIPFTTNIPGLIGHFQVDADGQFSTPIWPRDPAGIPFKPSERQSRLAIMQLLKSILSDNALVAEKPRTPRVSSLEPEIRNQVDDATTILEEETVSADAESDPPYQAAFDRLARTEYRSDSPNLGSVSELQLSQPYQQELDQQATLRDQRITTEKRRQSKETINASKQPAGGRVTEKAAVKREVQLPAGSRTALITPSAASLPAETEEESDDEPIFTFASEIDPFVFSMLDSGHFVLFRTVWRDGSRFIQGMLIERQAFLDGFFRDTYLDDDLASTSELIVAYRGDVFSTHSGQQRRELNLEASDFEGTLLADVRMAAPFHELALLFSVRQLQGGPGGAVIGWLSAMLLLVLTLGTYMMYRLGSIQIALTGQQQDFVSAVSHELKTPLTSIRMYGEMLREGWVSDEKRHSYYDFIFAESERLSRLIDNVLQLSRISRNRVTLNPRPVPIGELTDLVRSRVITQAQQAGFTINFECEAQLADRRVVVDPDGFVQILINLIDNSIKFSAKSDHRQIDISWEAQDPGFLLQVRDYGPGIPEAQLQQVFQLFYRGETELTRETNGTGIGLSLVQGLAEEMGITVNVRNQEPGVAFTLLFRSP